MRKQVLVGIQISIVTLALAGCGSKPSEPIQSPSTTATNTQSGSKVVDAFKAGTWQTTDDGLKIQDPKVGTGPAVAKGDLVNVIYTGMLDDGTVFDTNDFGANPTYDKKPFGVVVGNGSVIKGWDEGLIGMKLGGVRKLQIPAALAYGDKGQGPIPANSELLFTMKLTGLVKYGEGNVYSHKDVHAGSGPAVKSGDWVKISFVGKRTDGFIFSQSGATGDVIFQAGTGKMSGGKFLDIGAIPPGVIGMKKGGERILTIPPGEGFVNQAYPLGVDQTQVLVFDIKVLAIGSSETALEKP